MKYKIISIVIMFILLISFSAYAINFTPEETYNSVVVVYTDTGVGSGFSIKENIIITNAHVVGYNKKVAVNLYDGTTIKGSVIKIDIDKDKFIGADLNKVRNVVKCAFSSRRKMLVNNLMNTLKLSREQANNALERANISLTARAENLSAQDYVVLTEALDKGV